MAGGPKQYHGLVGAAAAIPPSEFHLDYRYPSFVGLICADKMQCMEWQHSLEQTGQQIPSSGLDLNNEPLVTASGAHMVSAPQAGNPLAGTAPSRIQPLSLHEDQTSAQAPMGGESYPYEIDCLELSRTDCYGALYAGRWLLSAI
jgi:hypothetical protein